jgi:hypothetical protein
MIMEARSKRLATPLHWGGREKAAIAGVLVALALALAGLGAYALSSGSPARADCVDVTFASTLGGGRLHGCGTSARRICAAGSFGGIEAQLRASCRRAGFPFVGRR